MSSGSQTDAWQGYGRYRGLLDDKGMPKEHGYSITFQGFVQGSKSAFMEGWRACAAVQPWVVGSAPDPTNKVAPAMDVVLNAMRNDPDYAWGWHCNIAMSAFDEGVPHGVANHAAARFLRLLAGVEPARELPTKESGQWVVDFSAEASTRLQAEAWMTVANLLHELHPNGWLESGVPAIDAAAKTIRQMAEGQRAVREALNSVLGAGWLVPGKTMAEAASAAIHELQEKAQAAEPAPYVDSAPQLHVGSSSFESWYARLDPSGREANTAKQLARDAYAAGMGDPLVAPKYEIRGDAASMLLREHNDLLTIVGEVVERGLLTQEDQARFRLYLDQPFIEGLNKSGVAGATLPTEALQRHASHWDRVAFHLNATAGSDWATRHVNAGEAAIGCINALQAKAACWRRVWAVLDEVSPDWCADDKLPVDAACDAIRELDMRKTHAEVKDEPTDDPDLRLAKALVHELKTFRDVILSDPATVTRAAKALGIV